MRLSVTAAATSSPLVWGVLTMYVTGMANMIWPTCGQDFLTAADCGGRRPARSA